MRGKEWRVFAYSLTYLIDLITCSLLDLQLSAYHGCRLYQFSTIALFLQITAVYSNYGMHMKEKNVNVRLFSNLFYLLYNLYLNNKFSGQALQPEPPWKTPGPPPWQSLCKSIFSDLIVKDEQFILIPLDGVWLRVAHAICCEHMHPVYIPAELFFKRAQPPHQRLIQSAFE